MLIAYLKNLSNLSWKFSCQDSDLKYVKQHRLAIRLESRGSRGRDPLILIGSIISGGHLDYYKKSLPDGDYSKKNRYFLSLGDENDWR